MAILDAVGNYLNQRDASRTAKRNTDRTIAANKREAELAYKRQLEMWHLQNKYNTPQAQMQRYTDAGLNPHLIYGQGTPGNASDIPKYQPADQQYQYLAPRYGDTVKSVMPEIMQIGSWLQDMRQGEANIQKTVTDTNRTDQIIGYMVGANPEMLKSLRNKNELFPYQKDSAKYGVDKVWQSLIGGDLKQRFDFGSDNVEKYQSIFSNSGFNPSGGISGANLALKKADLTKREAEIFVKRMEGKLKEAQASWTDFDITNPQALMQMVLSGALGMAGAGLSIRKPNNVSGKNRSKSERDFNETTKRFNEFNRRHR